MSVPDRTTIADIAQARVGRSAYPLLTRSDLRRGADQPHDQGIGAVAAPVHGSKLGEIQRRLPSL